MAGYQSADLNAAMAEHQANRGDGQDADSAPVRSAAPSGGRSALEADLDTLVSELVSVDAGLVESFGDQIVRSVGMAEVLRDQSRLAAYSERSASPKQWAAQKRQIAADVRKQCLQLRSGKSVDVDARQAENAKISKMSGAEYKRYLWETNPQIARQLGF